MGKRLSTGIGRKALERWQLYLMILPALTYLIIFAYKPMYGVLIAFKQYYMKKGVWGSPWVGFDNFERLFNSYWFPIILKNTLTLSLLSLVIGFPVPVLLALMVNEVENTFLKKTFQTVSYAPHFISTVVVCGMVTLFLSPTSGIINQFIAALGGEKVAFLQQPKMFKWIYVISGLWQSSGWSAVIYFAALSGVDKQLLEAAEIDGANRLQRVVHINLPVLVPTIVVLFILQCGSLLNVGYEKTYLLQNDTNLTGAEIISTYVYKMGLEKSDFSFSTATGLFNSVVNCAILITMNALSKKVAKTSLW
ncbi:MAG: ABC transporter permease subunit [Eubacteriales bacterium]|nr:ABC transporter permease subunit [Eubacteriales bacterium]